MHYRIVGPAHPVCLAEFEGEADEFFDGMLNPNADEAVLAKAGGVIVGWLRYYITPNDSGGKKMIAAGTWIEEEYRGVGIAQELWGRAMKRHKPKTVVVTTVTVEGRRLVGSLVSWFPKVCFTVLS